MALTPYLISALPATVAAVNPGTGVFLFILLIPAYALRTPVLLAGREVGLSIVEIAAVLLALTMLYRSRPRVQDVKKLFLRYKIIIMALAIFLLGLFLSLARSNDIFASLGIIRAWVLVPALLAAALLFWKEDVRKKRLVVLCAFFASFVLVALFSFFWPHNFIHGRLRGFYDSPNYLAMYLAPLLPLAIFYVLRATRARYIRYAGFWLLALGCFAILFSLSEGAWLGLGAALLLFLIVYFRSRLQLFAASASPVRGREGSQRAPASNGASSWTRRIAAPILLAALLGIVAGVFYLWPKILPLFYSRLGIWEASWRYIMGNPFLGIGAGMFQTAYSVQKHIVSFPVPLNVALHPHNIFLAAWLYGGILGLLGFWGIIWGILAKLKAGLRHVAVASPSVTQAGVSGEDRAFYIAIAASFATIMVHGLVDTTYWKNDLALIWWLIIAIL